LSLGSAVCEHTHTLRSLHLCDSRISVAATYPLGEDVDRIEEANPKGVVHVRGRVDAERAAEIRRDAAVASEDRHGHHPETQADEGDRELGETAGSQPPEHLDLVVREDDEGAEGERNRAGHDGEDPVAVRVGGLPHTCVSHTLVRQRV